MLPNNYLINVTNVEHNYNSLIISGIASNVECVTILIEERIDLHDLKIPMRIKIKCDLDKGLFNAVIDLNQFKGEYSKAKIWDIYFISHITNLKQRCLLDETLFKVKEPYHIIGSLKKVLPYITNDKALAIKVDDIQNLNVLIEDLTCTGTNINVKTSFEKIISNNCKDDFKVVLKKRERKDIFIYEDEYVCDTTSKGEQTLEFSLKIDDILHDKDIFNEDTWDCFIKVTDKFNVDQFLPVMKKGEKDYSFLQNKIINNPFFNAKYFFTKYNKLALWISLDKNFSNLRCDKVSWMDGKLSLNISCNENVIVKKAFINLRGNELYSKFTFCRIELPITVNNDTYVIDVIINELIEKYPLRDKLIWDVFCEVEDTASNMTECFALNVSNNLLPSNFEYYKINDTFKGKPFVTKKMTLSFYVKKIVEQSLSGNIKIGVLGSCYSRNAFNSAMYYNPFYKEKYTVSYALFHSAIPSIMSKPINFDRKIFEIAGNSNTEIGYIQDDFEKNFFAKLSSAKVDYLIIDLYADAVRDLIVFDNEHIITGTYLIRRTKDFMSSLKDNATIVTHNQKELFLKYWRQAAEKFAEKIVKYIPSKNIILNKSRMTDRYFDKKGNIKVFNDYNLINRSNNYFYYMENYLISLLPDIQIIDLSDCNFIGSELHPQGLSPNHYQPEFYKEFLSRVDNIVVKDLVMKSSNVK